MSFADSPWRDFRHASELMAYIASTSSVCMGGAAYPHGHQDDLDIDRGVEIMKIKEGCGVSFFITQLFYDNGAFFSFMEKTARAGIAKPIIPGIMPVLRSKQVKRLKEISGCSIPPGLQDLLDRFADDDESMEKAGIEFAAAQIRELMDGGVPGVHLYTMNRPTVSVDILRSVGVLG
jgi:methylenetetrahydrofolate reductase (NADPH)